MASYDDDKDGCLCLHEWKQLFCYLTGICPEEDEIHPDVLFNEFAGDDDRLSKTEFSIIYYLHCQECTQSQDELFDLYDEDHDYLLTLEEFSKLSCEVLGYCGC